MAMHPQNPEFLGEAGRQIAFLSAFLGGFAATFLGLVVHPGAPPALAKPTLLPPLRILMVITFIVGIYSSLLSLGLSGWIRSRQLGIVTSVSAFVSAVIMFLLLSL